MPLFQKSVEKKYLNSLDAALVEEKYAAFKTYFGNPEIQENIRNSKEEQFQEGFLRELFVKILGYTLNPAPHFNLTTELKNIADAKKVDGAVLKGEEVLAVIELKGTDTTDLDKIEAQAFGYKNNHPKCVYVITSNFEKLRFYIQNAIDFIDFDLFQLSKADFSLLWLCLQKDNLLSGLPQKMKEASLLKEEDITKQLYTDYSNFKRDIYANLIKNNPEKDKLLLFKKTQKLLDRFLFIFLAEDRLLLPPNSISEIVRQWETLKDLDSYDTLYNRFKKYFGYMDTGYKGKKYEIFAYNGGLFAPDELLDHVNIDDDLLYEHTLRLSAYDFETDVDVNILGHIFEHSLNEIENVQAEIRGEAVDSQKTKRKKDGIFYTPKYITKYIVENTVGKLCEEKKVALGIVDEQYVKGRKSRRESTITALNEKLDEYRKWLLQLTIIDPACGSGSFLNQILEFLIEEHRKVDQLRAQLFGDQLVFPDISKQILENNIYGVDLNEESVEIAKLSLWLRTAEKGRKLNNLNANIKCGNSLIDDPEIAGDKAFNWEKEFPKVFEKGGFDVVVGNPPYVNAKGENFSDLEKEFYYSNYKTAIYQIDTYILFIEIANKLLKDNRIASYIVPNAWLNNLLLGDVRKFILKNFQLLEIVDTPSGVFTDATVDTIIFNIRKNDIRDRDIKISKSTNNEIVFLHSTNQDVFSNNDNYLIDIFTSNEIRAILSKIEKGIKVLDAICNMTGGIKEYQRGKGKPKQSDSERLEQKFNASYKKDETFLPHLTGSELNRYLVNWKNQFLSYGEWLAEPRKKKYFEGERLIIREIPSKTGLIVSYTDEVYTIKNSAHICKPRDNNFSLKYLLAILNSRLLGFYFKNKFSEFDDIFPKAKIGQCKQLPIKDIPLTAQQSFISKADLMLSLNKELQEISSKFHRTLEREFSLEKLSKKLESWYELSYGNFLKELKKQKVDLRLGQKAEWEDYFISEQEKALSLQAKIESTDHEIDQMVYELYGLTEEEIRIVEEG